MHSISTHKTKKGSDYNWLRLGDKSATKFRGILIRVEKRDSNVRNMINKVLQQLPIVFYPGNP